MVLESRASDVDTRSRWEHTELCFMIVGHFATTEFSVRDLTAGYPVGKTYMKDL